jgi:hypothetical protein
VRIRLYKGPQQPRNLTQLLLAEVERILRREGVSDLREVLAHDPTDEVLEEGAAPCDSAQEVV